MNINEYLWAATKPGYRLHVYAGGKSGQHRAAHYLTGRHRRRAVTDSATENDRHARAQARAG